jgi:hypothetical protein
MFTAAIPLSNLLFGALASTVPVGLLIIVCGLIGAASGLGAFLHPLVRRAEAPPAAGIEA